jgi:hypothetical protein
MPAIARAVKPQPRAARGNGGTAAPRGSVGVGASRPLGARSPQWSPKGELQNTEYAKSLKQKAAPAASTPAAPAGAPWDSAYEASLAAAKAKYGNALTGIGAARLRTEQEYGLDPGFNGFASNPYSRAAELEQSFQRNNRASQTSLGGAGHLYSGSLQNQLGYNRTGHDREENSLKMAYQAALQELMAKELAAGDELKGAEAEAAWKKVEAAEKEPLEPETASAPSGGGGSGGGSYAKTKKGKKYGIGKGKKA